MDSYGDELVVQGVSKILESKDTVRTVTASLARALLYYNALSSFKGEVVNRTSEVKHSAVEIEADSIRILRTNRERNFLGEGEAVVIALCSEVEVVSRVMSGEVTYGAGCGKGVERALAGYVHNHAYRH